MDICTGTGCIALLLYHILWQTFPGLEVLGVDVSPNAINLAKLNLKRNTEARTLGIYTSQQLQFEQHDVFSTSFESSVLAKDWDIIISNPPYVSPKAFDTITSPSVRKFEPKLALVPNEVHLGPLAIETSRDEAIGDTFYSRLLEVTAISGAQAALFEVGDMEQAKRVVAKVLGMEESKHMEIWRDQPDQPNEQGKTVEVLGRNVPIRGEGHARSVLLYKDNARDWNWGALQDREG